MIATLITCQLYFFAYFSLFKKQSFIDEKSNNIVIKKSETNNDKGQMTYDDVVTPVSPKNVISDSEMAMKDSSKFKVNCD